MCDFVLSRLIKLELRLNQSNRTEQLWSYHEGYHFVFQDFQACNVEFTDFSLTANTLHVATLKWNLTEIRICPNMDLPQSITVSAGGKWLVTGARESMNYLWMYLHQYKQHISVRGCLRARQIHGTLSSCNNLSNNLFSKCFGISNMFHSAAHWQMHQKHFGWITPFVTIWSNSAWK